MLARSSHPSLATRVPGLLAAALALGIVLLLGVGDPSPAAARSGCENVQNGTAGPEVLDGTAAADLLRARSGADRITGLADDDCVRGGGGADRVSPGGGADLVSGGPGADVIRTRDGFPDQVDCGPGKDIARVDPLDTVKGCERVRGGGGSQGPGGDCRLDPGTLTAVGCSLVRSDTAERPDPTSLWGQLDCASATRHRHLSGSADPHATASGEPQPDDAFRRLTVQDGDDLWGERCELGLNDHTSKNSFAVYREGDHALTFLSVRLGPSFQLDSPKWQTIVQMKQAQPYSDDGNAGVALEVQARNDNLYLSSFWKDVWETPVSSGAWTRIALDVHYSQHESRGAVTMYVDSNGDGDAVDGGEQSPTIEVATLAGEIGADDGDGLRAGDSIPSHLRTGVYHDKSIGCPSGCSIDLDNVQVVG